MQLTLIDQGLNLMLYGMGTVFVFLTILVFATQLMSRIVARFPVADESKADTAGPPPANKNGQPSPQILAAIKLAISLHTEEQHRKQQQRRV